jgi:hypothetical protein
MQAVICEGFDGSAPGPGEIHVEVHAPPADYAAVDRGARAGGAPEDA